MATNPLRNPLPGMSVSEEPMNRTTAQMFGGRNAPMPGVSVVERPMAASERAQFGLRQGPNIDAEVTQRAQANRAARVAAPPTPAPVPAAAPPVVGPGQQTLAQRARNGLKGLGGAAARIGVAGAAGAGAVQGFQTPTEDYRRRFGMETDDPSFLGDLGVRALGVGSDVVDAASFGALRPLFRDQRDPAATPLTPGVAAPTPAPSPAGAGRGGVESPLRTDRDPTSAAFGASRDFTPELASVPSRLPGDLRSGVIHRTDGPNGPVYSGRDVRGPDPQMVDGMGRTLRGGGTVSTVPGMSRDEIDRTLRRGPYAAPDSNMRPAMPAGAAPGSLLDTPKARRANEQLRLGREQIDTTRRGQDLTYAAQMADTNERREGRAAATREKGLAAAETRRRASTYMQQANGNPLEAARAARMAGDTDIAKDFDGAAEGEDKITVQRNEQYRKMFAPLATATDENGKGRVDDALLEGYVSMADSAAQAVGMPVEDLMKNPARFRGAVKLVESLNKNREDTWLKRIGWDDTDPVSQVPQMQSGGLRARTEKVLNPLSASGFGARRILLPNGGQVTLDKESFDDPEIRDLLGSMGVR